MPKDHEILDLIRQVRGMSACTMDFDAKLSRLERLSGCSEIGRWIFDPPNGKNLSAEEILAAIRSSDSTA